MSPTPPEPTGLRALRHVYTANDPVSRHAVFTKLRAGAPTAYDGGRLAVDDVYAASTAPPRPGDDAPAPSDDSGALASGRPGGTVCRVVDLAPRHACAMRRARNLDYAVVVEGCVIVALDSGDEATLCRGDVAVQRAAGHVWRNPSDSEWARLVFVLHDCQGVGRPWEETPGQCLESSPARSGAGDAV